MIWADYDRALEEVPERVHQARGRSAPRTQIQQATGKVDAAAQAAGCEDEHGQGPSRTRPRTPTRSTRPQGERDKLDGEWYRVDQDLPLHQGRDRRRPLRVRGGRPQGRRGNASEEAEDARRPREALERAAQATLEDVNARRDAAARAHRRAARRRASRRRRRRRRSSRRRRASRTGCTKIQPGFVTFVRNLPVLDMLNPSLKVNQIMPANLHDDVIFTGTPKVDRCTTCHLGIDKKGYENAPQPYTTHPNLETVPAGAAPDRPHRLHRLPPGPRARHQLRERGAHAVDARSRRRPGESTRAATSTTACTTGTCP